MFLSFMQSRVFKTSFNSLASCSTWSDKWQSADSNSARAWLTVLAGTTALVPVWEKKIKCEICNAHDWSSIIPAKCMPILWFIVLIVVVIVDIVYYLNNIISHYS